ncbi:Pyranose 2-oxidase [Termitomyces sp. T112]|nr:Pyranose 2-oxidase [Termitomyces sp. T112]
MAGLPLHRVHKDTGIDQFDVCIYSSYVMIQAVDKLQVFIVGSGPIGALYARQLVDNGHSVIMTEIGDQDTRVPGAHKKNEIEYQKDIDRFVRVIQGALATVSIPVSSSVIPTLDPSAWRASDPEQKLISNGRNPFQKEYNNLGAQAVTRGVGGMSTHWTCATPELLERDANENVYERPVIYQSVHRDNAEWELLYNAARSIIGTSTTEYAKSIRHNIVLKTLQDHYKDRKVQPLPLACHRLRMEEGSAESPYVQWHAADNIFGDMFDPAKKKKKNAQDVERGEFVLLTNTRCTKLYPGQPNSSSDSSSIKFAEVKDLLEDLLYPGSSSLTDYIISAKARSLSHLRVPPTDEYELRPVPSARACSSCFIPDPTSLRSVRSLYFKLNAKSQTQPHFVRLGPCISNSMPSPRPNLTSFG